jgi:hypothetical protein
MTRRITALMIALLVSASGLWIALPGASAMADDDSASIPADCASGLCPMHHGPDGQPCICQMSAPDQGLIVVASSDPGIPESSTALAVTIESHEVDRFDHHAPASALIDLTTPPPRA